MAVFDHRAPATYFPMRAVAIVAHDGAETPVRGEVLVRVEQPVAPFGAGQVVRAIGMLYPPGPPLNPGTYDYEREARATGRAGLLAVGERDLVEIGPPPGPSLRSSWLRWRESLRGRAGGWLLSNLPDTDRTSRDALLSELLLGWRGPDPEGTAESFRKAGLAHVLAISGMHLTVLAGFVLALVRLGGVHHPWHGWLVIGVVLVYLVLVEARMPVLRAGIMTIAACLGLVARRRVHVGALLSGSAVVLLLWRPDQLTAPGFQLTYGVVLGLIYLAPLVRRRLFGPPNALASSSAEMLGQSLLTAAAVALTAWAVSCPIGLYHWGVAWPLAAPVSVLVLPLVTVVLAAGYLKMVLAVALPSAALLAGVPLAATADMLIAVVGALDDLPGSEIAVPPPPASWAMAAEAWIAAAIVLAARPFRPRLAGRLLAAAGVVLAAWLVRPALPEALGGPRHGALRIDMVAVGDGSCYLLRSAGSTVVFDAGSSSDLDAGRRQIVPAMRRLGVLSVDAVLISHPNLDHYSAVLEIVDAFGAGAVLVTRQFARDAAADPSGPLMFLLDELSRRNVTVTQVAAGDARTFGVARFTWLHPDMEKTYARANDGSMVVSVEAGGRRVLFCGDIQAGAIDAVLARGAGEAPRADVMEIPHHGSYTAAARAFVECVGPGIVLQSTAPWRWRSTARRWETPLRAALVLVTARDGACCVRIGRDGTITVRKYRDSVPARSIAYDGG